MRRLGLVLVLAAACSSKSSEPAAGDGDAAAKPGPTRRMGRRLEILSEEVTLAAGSRAFGGTLTRPPEGRWPGILLLAGSGPTDRDWNSPLLPGKNGSGKLLAEAIASSGAVVLRFDKAGSGSNPPPPGMTFDTYLEEGQAALAELRGRQDVDWKHLFVAGHSEGGIHAIRLALAEQGQVAGVILLATPGRPMKDVVLAQLEEQFKSSAKLPPAEVARHMNPIRRAFTDFLAGKDVDPARASPIPAVQQLLAAFMSPVAAPIARPLLAFDPAAEAAMLGVPVLIVNGGHDIQIDQREGRRLFDAIRKHNREVTLHVQPGANHVLKAEKRSLAELRANPEAAVTAYNADGQALEPALLRKVLLWLGSHWRGAAQTEP